MALVPLLPEASDEELVSELRGRFPAGIVALRKAGVPGDPVSLNVWGGIVERSGLGLLVAVAIKEDASEWLNCSLHENGGAAGVKSDEEDGG